MCEHIYFWGWNKSEGIERREKWISSKVSGHFFSSVFEKGGFFEVGLLGLVSGMIWLFLLKSPLTNILVIQESWLFIFDVIMKCIDGQVMGNSIFIIDLEANEWIKFYFSSSSVKYIFRPVARLVI
jgi:hypothetical protein